MNQIKCEMCGSTELVKQDGLFVCQYCGMKYSLEEAKKMLIEGTVEVQGTVKVDNTPFVAKYLANARRAKEKEDWEEVEKYYNMVEQNDPANIEAIFFSAYGKAKQTLVHSDYYPREAAFKVLRNSISVIDDNFDLNNVKEGRALLGQMTTALFSMDSSSYVYNQTTRSSTYTYSVTNDAHRTEVLFLNLHTAFIGTLENIIKKFPPERAKETATFYPLLIQHAEHMMKRSKDKKWAAYVCLMHENWHGADPSHEIPQQKTPSPLRDFLIPGGVLAVSLGVFVGGCAACSAVF